MQTYILKKSGRKALGGKFLLPAFALLLAIAILVAGTLAYSQFQQAVLNPFEGFVANGTRLHDDYKGVINEKENPKDVYVENFGTTPLLVRVRFSEYFELGGTALLGTSKSNTGTWAVRKPGVVNAASADWGWTMGGQKWYLPTDNLDDIINGTPTGPDADKPDNIIGRSWYGAVTGSALETKNQASAGTPLGTWPFAAASPVSAPYSRQGCMPFET